MVTEITVDSYNNNRFNTLRVQVGNLIIWYSYRTPIAFLDDLRDQLTAPI